MTATSWPHSSRSISFFTAWRTARRRIFVAAALASLVSATGVPAAPSVPVQTSGADWPQILGPARNASTTTTVAVWPQGGPEIRWREPIGEGFAGPAVVGNRLILFHRVADEEVVEARDTATGATMWRTGYPTTYRDDFGFDEGPRATPTISDGTVFTFGAQGILQALDLETGELAWRHDTHDEFGVRKGFFGAASAPLVHDGIVMVNVGGTDGAGIVGFDAAGGAVLWTATDDEASSSAPVMATLGSRETALFFTRAGLVALEPRTGETFARFPWRSRSGSSVNAATPLLIDGRVFISASYGTGAALLDVGTTTFRPVWSSDEALTNHYATSVYTDGYLYGYHGRQEYSPAFRAVEAATGEPAWSEERFGGGTVILAGDRLLILRERGELILAEATPAAFRPLARAQVLGGIIRAYPALADGALFARNERELVAVELPSR